MPELEIVLENNAFNRKVVIHDNVSDGTDNQTLLSGVSQVFTCNALGYEYKSSTEDLWDGSLITDGIVNAKLDIKIQFSLTCASNDKRVVQELYIPDPGGDILIEQEDYYVTDKNQGEKQIHSTFVYISPEALMYGFKIRLTAEADMTLADKSILIAKG